MVLFKTQCQLRRLLLAIPELLMFHFSCWIIIIGLDLTPFSQEHTLLTPKSFRPKAWALLTHLLVTAPTRIKWFIQRETAPSGRMVKNPLQMAWGQHSEDTPDRCMTWVQLFFTQPYSSSVCVRSLMNRLSSKGLSHLFMTFKTQIQE